MTVTFDAVGPGATGAGTDATPANTLTWSHTVANQSNRLLLVSVSCNNGSLNPPTATFNGTSMTLVGTQDSNNSSSAGFVALFRLVNPDVGTFNVVADGAGTVTTDIVGGSMSFYGVDQTTPLGTPVTGSGNTDSIAVTVPSVDTGNMAVQAVCMGGSVHLAETPSHTKRWVRFVSSANGAGESGAQTATGAGSDVAFAWNGGGEWWGAIGVEVLAAPEGLTAPSNFTATPVSSSQIDLSWNAVTGATGYDIERDGEIILVGHPTTSYSDTGLTASTQYTYRVRTVG